MKEKDKDPSKHQSKMNISKMTTREFRVMIIKTITGFEKRGEGISETLNKEIKGNQSEMKNITNEIKNVIDRKISDQRNHRNELTTWKTD